ncbi:hypothetical protein COCOBI_06-6760 [Coccomyxa sp. Obi]|nr:hypothetical protein COCOBI_06-6700 [Coccomyxa sp. Obi]BDA45193.1 hypothetical protein COCOBI_06-6760 [Coccomyxa sp. Obi]
MEVLYDPKCAMCPAEPDSLATGGCNDGCELLTGEVCEASWWDGLLNGCEADGPGPEFSEGQQADTCMVSLWHRLAPSLPRIVGVGELFASQVEDKGSAYKMVTGAP